LQDKNGTKEHATHLEVIGGLSQLKLMQSFLQAALLLIALPGIVDHLLVLTLDVHRDL